MLSNPSTTQSTSLISLSTFLSCRFSGIGSTSGFKAKAVVDCTAHEAEVLTIAARKIPELGLTIPGESSMWVAEGEKLVVEKTGEVCPGLYVAGMAVAALHGTPRMGPIFGGMLMSGKRVAELVKAKIHG